MSYLLGCVIKNRKCPIIINFKLIKININYMSQNIIPEKVPDQIWNAKRYEDIILYTLGDYGPLEREEFINDSEKSINDRMNKNTFYKWVKLLKKNNWVEVSKEGKKSVYKITSMGQDELLRRLKNYNLDFETLNKIEQKRISNYIELITKFFKENDVIKSEIKLEFLKLANDITFDKFKDIFSIEKFNKLLLFLVLNHPRFYLSNNISIEDFLKKYNINSRDDITKPDILFFVQKVVGENIYGVKYYQLILEPNKMALYFSSNSEFGIFFETTIKSRLKDLYYLKNLGKPSLEILREEGIWTGSDQGRMVIDLYHVYKNILDDLINKYKLFHKDLRASLHQLLDNYIKDIKEDFIKKPPLIMSELKEIGSLPLESPQKIKEKHNKSYEYYEFYIKDMNFTFSERMKEKLNLSNEFLINAYDFFFKERKDNLALEEIVKAVKFDQKSAEIYRLKAFILLRLKKYDEALKTIDKAIELAPKNLIFYEDKIKTLVLLEKGFQSILEVVSIVSNLRLENSDFYSFVATLFIENEQYELARKMIDKGEESDDPEYFSELIFQYIMPAYCNQINKKLKEENYEEALKIIDKHIISTPKIHEYKIEAFVGLKKYDDALNVVDEAIKIWPKYPQHFPSFKYDFSSYIPSELITEEFVNITKEIDGEKVFNGYKFCRMKADLLYDMGNYEHSLKIIDEVIDNYENSLKIFENYPPYLGDKIVQTNEMIEAELNHLKGIELPEPYITKALNQYNLERYNAALESIDKAIDLAPENPRYYYIKIQLLQDMNFHNDYLKEIAKIIYLDPSTTHYIYDKAYFLAKLNKKEEALATINKLIEKNPEKVFDYEIVNFLAKLNKKEEALATINKLIEKNPEEGRYYIKYGEVLMMFKDYNEAVNIFKNVLNLEPDYRLNEEKFIEWDVHLIYDSYINMGKCYKELGMYDIALENFIEGKRLAEEVNNYYLVNEADKHISEII